MDNRLLSFILKTWARQVGSSLDELDACVRGARGPAGALPLRAFAIGTVYSAMSGTGGTITSAVRSLQLASAAQLHRIGTTRDAVTYKAARTAMLRLAAHIEAGGYAAGQLWLDVVVAPSADLGKPARVRAVDTSLFRAHCRRGGCRALVVVGDDTDLASVARPAGVYQLIPVSAAQALTAVFGEDPTLYEDHPSAAEPRDTPASLAAIDAIQGFRKRRSSGRRSRTRDVHDLIAPGRLIRVSCDPHARLRRLARAHGPDKVILGYGVIAVVRADIGEPELCERIALRPANANDVPVGAELVLGLSDFGPSFATVGTRVVADRAFNNQHQAFLAPLRAQGVHVSFDLKSTDHQVQDWRGNLLIDGMLFSHALPRRLRHLPRPNNTATANEWASWRSAIAERMTYAFLPNGRPGTNEVRLHSPVNPKRARGRCGSVPVSANYVGEHLWTCRTHHAPGEGCDLWNVTFCASDAPRTWQFPVWGTPEWEQTYAQRNAVERYFSRLKSPYGSRWGDGSWPLRTLPKLTVSLGLAVVATNLAARYERKT